MEKYVKPFISVTVSVFKDFAGCTVESSNPYFSEKDAMHEWDYSGVIGISGDARGAVVISMKENLANRLTGSIVENKTSPTPDEIADAIGEIVNIITGNVKRDLEETTFRLVISTPTVVKGKNHRIMWPHNKTHIICIPFKIFETDMFNLQVAIESNKDPAGA
jgi:chemotaxis protein CheX